MSDQVFDLPTKMRAIQIGETRTADSLYIDHIPVPSPGAYEVLVAVGAAGVNRGDCYQRLGFYPAPPGASDIMGLEFSGTVVALGDHVTRWQIGDRIAALVAGGAYAEFANVHEDHALPIPEGMSLIEAASLPETIFTVWANVFEGARLEAGNTLLIHGGTSGIGTTAIQMAKQAGATVITTAGSDDKCQACMSLGANHAINYKTQDFVEAVGNLTNGVGADVILDMVGGDYVARNIACAARGGRIVNIAFLNGSKVEIDLMPVMLKNLTLTGSTLRARAIEEKTRLTKCVAKNAWPHIESSIKPVIDQVFPLSQAGAAHNRMETSVHIGKIILDCTL